MVDATLKQADFCALPGGPMERTYCAYIPLAYAKRVPIFATMGRYWLNVLHRAWQDAWNLVIQHSVRALLRNGIIFIVACVLLYYLQGDLIGRHLTSSDNLPDTVVWAVFILIAAVAIFGAVFVIEALFIVPFQMWRELDSQVKYTESSSASMRGLQSGEWQIAYPPSDDYPNWTIRELFYHIDPDVLDHWEEIAAKVRDQLSLGRLKSWGRKGVQTPLDKSCGIGPAPLSEIYPHYWGDASFTYTFFDEGKLPTERTSHLRLACVF